MRKNYIPPLISLSAGLIASIITITDDYEPAEGLLIVFASLLLFYILGYIVKIVMAKFIVIPKQEENNEDEGNVTEKKADGEEAGEQEQPKKSTDSEKKSDK